MERTVLTWGCTNPLVHIGQVAATSDLQVGSALRNLSGLQLTQTARSTWPARQALAAPFYAISIGSEGHPIEAELRESYTLQGLSNEAAEVEQLAALVEKVRWILRNFAESEGEISDQAYGTAWVARVPALDGSGKPEFPECLDWIIKNQLLDGSWGDKGVENVADRILGTLAALLCLATWDRHCHEDQLRKGEQYIWRNLDNLDQLDDICMPAAFELLVPSLTEDARKLELNLPYEAPVLAKLYHIGQKKRERIPTDVLYSRRTSLLYSIEGLDPKHVDWERLLKLQLADGSILHNPAATAFVLIHTGDRKCHDYLRKVLRKFGNAVPDMYSFEVFQKLWVVDTLERLGIDCFFKEKIEEALHKVYRSWSDNLGLGWSTIIGLEDLDDTAMGFRLLRKHGYVVKDEAFKNFRKNNEFFCYEGQLVQAVSDMFQLHRAGEMCFPGESILKEGFAFSDHFLRDAISKNTSNADKWSMKKDLYGEILFNLQYPLHTRFLHLEINNYINKYGPSDAWQAKTIYRLPLLNNQSYLNLAKAYQRSCQSLYKIEHAHIIRWLVDAKVENSSPLAYELFLQRCINPYFMFAAELWEQDFAMVRMVAAKSTIVAMLLIECFTRHPYSEIKVLAEAIRSWDPHAAKDLPKTLSLCFNLLWTMVDSFAQESIKMKSTKDAKRYIRYQWERLVESLLKEATWREFNTIPSLEEYWEHSRVTVPAQIGLLSSILFSKETISDEVMCQFDHRSQFWRKSCLFSRLAIDMHTNDTQLSSLKCYLAEHQNATSEDAMHKFCELQQSLLPELNMEIWRSNDSSISMLPQRLMMCIFKCSSIQLLSQVIISEDIKNLDRLLRENVLGDD